MKLSKKAIKELIEIHQEQFGEIISEDEAEVMGLNLIRLFKIIYRPLPQKEIKSEKR